MTAISDLPCSPPGPRTWSETPWTAKIVKNPDDEGWAVEMWRDGDPEPALVGPWTMGRDKKNPKPLDKPSFITLVKTASEFLGRIEQQRSSSLKREIVLGQAPDRTFVSLEIVPDDDFPSAILTATDEAGSEIARKEVPSSFSLSRDSAAKWLSSL